MTGKRQFAASLYPRRALMALSRALAPFVIAFVFLAAPANAGQAINTAGEEQLALKGFDAVGYFTKGRAEAGSKDFEYEWQGETWRFDSAAHRDAFAADPEKYAPQYGGYSAYGVSQGIIAAGDPTAWTIYNAKLYLNASEADRKLWLAAFVGYIGTADGKWPKLKPDSSP